MLTHPRGTSSQLFLCSQRKLGHGCLEINIPCVLSLLQLFQIPPQIICVTFYFACHLFAISVTFYPLLFMWIDWADIIRMDK